VIYVKNNVTDASAGILYSLGCSLVHLVLFISIMLVKQPNQDAAHDNDEQWFQMLMSIDSAKLSEHKIFISQLGDFHILVDCVHKIQDIQHHLMLLHAIIFFICIWREMNAASTTNWALFTRFLELFFSLWYMVVQVSAFKISYSFCGLAIHDMHSALTTIGAEPHIIRALALLQIEYRNHRFYN